MGSRDDPLLSLRLYSFILCVVSVLYSGMSGLIWGGVLICSPYYLLVVYVGGHILFPGVYIQLYIGDCLIVVLSCDRTQCRGLGTYSYLYFHYCNFILVNISFGPTA